MFKKILFFLCLFITSNVIAQENSFFNKTYSNSNANLEIGVGYLFNPINKPVYVRYQVASRSILLNKKLGFMYTIESNSDEVQDVFGLNYRISNSLSLQVGSGLLNYNVFNSGGIRKEISIAYHPDYMPLTITNGYSISMGHSLIVNYRFYFNKRETIKNVEVQHNKKQFNKKEVLDKIENNSSFRKSSWNIYNPSIIDKKKRSVLLISQMASYTLAVAGLNQLWYNSYPKSSFHFINDNCEWLQMDKVGHMTTSYYSGVLGIKAYNWTGMKRKNAIWFGGLAGTFFLTAIEVLDGKSEKWGASPGDLMANTTGSLFAIGQALKWNEQRIQLKFSYSPSIWAPKNPEQLGNSHLERVLKDYNGQTYWLSFNLKSLIQIDDVNFPNWLNLSFGYGAHFMKQPYTKDGGIVWRKRQYLLSLDVDLTRIKTKSKVLNSVLHTFGFLKFPMPTIELRNGKLYGYPIYY